MENANRAETRLHEKIRRELGPDFMSALDDQLTIEIMLNPDGELWQERLGEPMKRIGQLSASQADAAIRTVAGCLNKTATQDNPILEGVFPLDGSRIACWLPPITKSPSFALRKHASRVFTLDNYLESGTLTDNQVLAIRSAVQEHRNILVIGGTGSGKTTLCNAVIAEITKQNPTERIFIIEDTGEIQCQAKNAVQLCTSIHVSMTKLLETTLRGRPDRILVGEVRSAAALDLLDAWNTGHEGGIATLHANNAREALDRLKSLITRHESAPKEIEPLIGKVVHMIIHIAKTESGRRVKEIIEVQGFHNGIYQVQTM